MIPRLLAQLRVRGLQTEQELVYELLGERPRGSWWSHPRAKAVYDTLLRLHEEPDLLSCKLVDGKQTFVHRRLWPALARAQRERELWPEVTPAAERLLREVRGREEVAATGKPRAELERALRVVGTSRHTERGSHDVVLVPFERWLPDDVRAEADTLSLETALEQLATAGFVPARSRRKKRG